VVEFAPFQRLPKKRLGRKKDPKMGTLEQDPAYISFLESKAAKPTETGSTQHCSLEYFPPPESKSLIDLVHSAIAFFFFIWFVRLLALRPLLAYCASLG
jgi:hypothetical protein